MSIRRLLALGLLGVLVLVGGGCGNGDDNRRDADGAAVTTTSDGASGEDATTVSAAGTPREPETTLADADDSGRSELEDGRHFGYWKTFEVGDTTAFGEFDLAYFLDGDEAEKAAAEDGEEVTNDYYIVNDNPRLRTLIVNGDADVTVLGGTGRGPETEASNVADFAVGRHEDAGFWVTIEDGMVTEIEEQYQP